MIATLVVRITRDVIVATALAALIGPLRVRRDMRGSSAAVLDKVDGGHRTGHEKADAEGMLLPRHSQPIVAALRKATSSSNEIADGDPSYDGTFYASTSGTPAIEKVERRRYDRMREVLGVDGMSAPLEDTATRDERPSPPASRP